VFRSSNPETGDSASVEKFLQNSDVLRAEALRSSLDDRDRGISAGPLVPRIVALYKPSSHVSHNQCSQFAGLGFDRQSKRKAEEDFRALRSYTRRIRVQGLHLRAQELQAWNSGSRSGEYSRATRLHRPVHPANARAYYSDLSRLESDFPNKLSALEERITQAASRAGRTRSEIALVAVTKKFSAAAIRTAYQYGIRNFGENYVQEFASKQHAVSDLSEAKYHLIGHLQANKARAAIELFATIHTVDSAKLLDRLNRLCAETQRTVDVLLELKLTDEPRKTGLSYSDMPGLMEAAARCDRLRVLGVMTMPPWSEKSENSRPYFRKLAAIAREYALPQLSMGMSNDFEVAIEEGATIIRIGSALFGARPKAATNEA
jgi:pyridoxal phosphate enzyme (YggS family)